MKRNVFPSVINGEIRAPSSKSMMARTIVAGLLAEGITGIRNPSFCDDALAALRISEQLGAGVESGKDWVRITGGFNPRADLLDCGESGLGIRMFPAIASLHNSQLCLTGTGSLKNRPVNMIEQPLTELGVACETTNGLIPIRVKGPINGGKAKVDGATSSQFLTGLLMSLPLAANSSELQVKDLKSKPYIDLTLKVLNDFGIEIENRDYHHFIIKGNQQYKARDYEIEGDWSGTAFLLTAGALNGRVRITGIQPNSPQADRKILSALEMAGANIVIEGETIHASSGDLKSFQFDATDCPDLFPPLVALAAHCEGVTVISGAHRLKSKESNRALVLQKEFSNLNVRIELNEDQMFIHGGTVDGGSVHSNNDHRIAMAAAVAGIKANGQIEITGSECVSKSYPYFFEDFINMGGVAYE